MGSKKLTESPGLKEISLEEITRGVDKDLVKKMVREDEKKLREWRFNRKIRGARYCDFKIGSTDIEIDELSTCCGAPVTYSKCGVAIPVCSACGKEYKQIIIENKGY